MTQAIRTTLGLALLFLVVGKTPAFDSPRGPGEVVATPDGQTLFAALGEANRIAQIDLGTRRLVREFPSSVVPSGLCLLGEKGALAVVGGSEKGEVTIIDPASGTTLRSLRVGHTPRAPVYDPTSNRLYVCNRFDGTISVLDLAQGREIGRIPVAREPWDAALSADGKTLVVSHLLPDMAAKQPHLATTVSLIDPTSLDVRSIRLPQGSTSARGVCVTPDGHYALVVHLIAKFQLPTTQVERGWMNTNALSVIDLQARERLGTVLLDDVDRGAGNPWDVAVTADGHDIIVSHAGTHELSVIDAAALIELLLARKTAGISEVSTTTRQLTPEQDLSLLASLRRRIPLNPPGMADQEPLSGPRGLAVVGRDVHVAVYFSDAVASLLGEEGSWTPAPPIRLGAPAEITAARRGEQIFHDATLGLQGWQSCSSCHPDARNDGLNWDLLNDGIGNPRNTKSMLLAHQTPPAMITGIRKDAETAVRSGFRYILFRAVPEGDAEAVDAYLRALQPVPSPHLIDGRFSPQAERGRALFESERLRCHTCHPAPLFTDQKTHLPTTLESGTGSTAYDTPTLVELWRTGPYLQDGRYATLPEVFRDGRHGDVRGDVESLDEEELNALVAYLLSL